MSAIRFTDVVPHAPPDGWPGPISFEIPAGTFTVFGVGPGESVALVRLMIGLRSPAEGRVEVLGCEPGRLGRWDGQRFRRRLGVGFDEPSGLVSNLDLHENLVIPVLYSGLADRDTADRKASTTLSAFGLDRWARSRPSDLPPEVRRTAVMARAAIRDP
jgi:phospholipid/cholesterol/gamma-HCH transport system ATP-binding protein